MNIDYGNIDPRWTRTIKSIEGKAHVKYIRYLLSKKYSPVEIKTELRKLGLSSSHEQHLTAYFFSVIEPVIKKHNLSAYYADYKNKLLRKNKKGDFAKNILNYRLHISDSFDSQVDFCNFVKELEIDELWINEIYKVHGTAANLPVGVDGKRILSTNTTYKNYDKILLCEKRYLIDQMILENVPSKRIADYCREKLSIKIFDHDVRVYKRIFFSVQTQDIEGKLKLIITEKNSLQEFLKDLREDNSDCADLTIGEKSNLIKQTTQRIKELEDSIKALNAMYSENASKIASFNEADFSGMFTDVATRAYRRFLTLDKHKDRDVVDPLIKTAKMMGYAFDKVEELRISGRGGKNTENGDMHSKSVTIELYKARLDEINDEIKKDAGDRTGETEYGQNISFDDIEGINELNISYDEE